MHRHCIIRGRRDAGQTSEWREAHGSREREREKYQDKARERKRDRERERECDTLRHRGPSNRDTYL